MKECDIFEGVKTYSDPSYIFSWGQDYPTPRISAPGSRIESSETSLLTSHILKSVWLRPQNEIT